MRGVIHGTAETTDSSEAASSLAADLITLSATVKDKEGDSSTGSANIGDKLVFHDDGPTVGVRHAFEVDFTADAAAADHVIGNIGGVGGADTTASVKLTTYTDLAGFFEEKVGDNTVIYHKGTDATGDAFFKFTVDGDGNYDFTVLKSGSATNESFNFGSVKPGAPIETVTVKSQFGHAIGVFDGVIFNGAGANNYVNSPTKNVDDINTDKLGFGIVGNNPNQASQINNNEGFHRKAGPGVRHVPVRYPGHRQQRQERSCRVHRLDRHEQEREGRWGREPSSSPALTRRRSTVATL